MRLNKMQYIQYIAENFIDLINLISRSLTNKLVGELAILINLKILINLIGTVVLRSTWK